ncbi:hypothetical protein [Halobellus ruber]|uniref:Rpa-associated protein n=1 Tax=Halobellus ruber TaxID=2761102 RepID=A0A7J9SG82_9EURY|nr:hypothetical protein [Halobellus ruber]MBB6645950.1 hypothetical protein [Halobellus ruber]
MSDEVQEREIARRVFAAEFDDATLSYSESDEERAPNYVVTPTGARVNRLFAVGALTEVEAVNDDVLRGRIADPTGAFVTYAGQYQPDAAGFLERTTPPCFVSITGKGRTYQPEDSDRIFTSVRPESLTEVDADTRDRWVVAAADATLDRIATMAAALDLDARGEDLRAELESRGVDAAHASGVVRAIDHYRPTEHYLEAVRRLAVRSLDLVAGERDTVETLDVAPDEAGPNELGALPAVPAASTASGGSAEPAGATPSPEASGADAESTAARDAGGGTSVGDTATIEGTTAASEESATSPTDDASTAGDGPGEAGSTASEPSTAADEEVDATAGSDDDLGDFGADDPDESELYELDEEERAEIESEYDTEFATGNEVDDPGEADIDVPDVEDLEAEAAAAAEGDAGSSADGSATSGSPSADSTVDPTPAAGGGADGTDADAAADTASDAGGADDVDLEATAVDVMSDLDDGDGADREAVVERVVEAHGVDADAVESAIQDALMGGKCYEPAEGRLKAI